MIDFIDKTSEQDGTPLNRKNLMAIQGFQASTIKLNADGSITEINVDGNVLSVIFNANGSITETFSGEKIISRTTTFNEDGTIQITMS